jgi:hypothetical protein
MTMSRREKIATATLLIVSPVFAFLTLNGGYGGVGYWIIFSILLPSAIAVIADRRPFLYGALANTAYGLWLLLLGYFLDRAIYEEGRRHYMLRTGQLWVVFFVLVVIVLVGLATCVPLYIAQSNTSQDEPSRTIEQNQNRLLEVARSEVSSNTIGSRLFLGCCLGSLCGYLSMWFLLLLGNLLWSSRH